MERRTFLKLAGLTSLTGTVGLAAVAANPPAIPSSKIPQSNVPDEYDMHVMYHIQFDRQELWETLKRDSESSKDIQEQFVDMHERFATVITELPKYFVLTEFAFFSDSPKQTVVITGNSAEVSYTPATYWLRIQIHTSIKNGVAVARQWMKQSNRKRQNEPYFITSIEFTPHTDV